MLQSTKPIEAILWDMDGTLSDTEPLHQLAYQQWLARFNVDFSEEDYRQFLGATDRVICETLIDSHKLPVSAEQMMLEKEELVLDLLRSQATPRPGVTAVLAAARRYKLKMAVASSSALATIELVLDTLQIRHQFDQLASGEEVEHSKPAPDVFLLAAKRLGVAPETCLVIEDSINGILAAKAAGMKCLAVACESTRYQDHSTADIVLESHEQISIDTSGLLAGGTAIRLHQSDAII